MAVVWLAVAVACSVAADDLAPAVHEAAEGMVANSADEVGDADAVAERLADDPQTLQKPEEATAATEAVEQFGPPGSEALPGPYRAPYGTPQPPMYPFPISPIGPPAESAPKTN